MGVGLLIHAVPQKRGLLRGGADPHELLEEAATFFSRAVDEPLLRRLMRITRLFESDALQLQLHPAEEDVYFEWKGGHLEISARTSSTGPGYHAWLCRLLEQWAAEAKCTLVVENGDDEDGPLDETGYLVHHDFTRVQDEMLAWLRGLGRMLTEQDYDDYSNISISMPMGSSPREPDCFARTQLGPRPKAWFQSIADQEELRGIVPVAQDHFCWWNEERDAQFYAQLGRLLCWMSVPWRQPHQEFEALAMEVAVAAFDRARELDPEADIPEKEYHELRYLLGLSQDEAYAPSTQGIGYRRGKYAMDLPGGWTVHLPGYYVEDVENEGKTAMFWFGDRTVRFSSWTLTGKDGQVPLATEVLSEPEEDVAIIHHEDGNLIGWAQEVPPTDTEEGVWLLMGHSAVDGHSALLSVTYEQEEDHEWAIQVWKSLSPPPAKE